MNEIESTLNILKELEEYDGILRPTLFTILEGKPAQGISWSKAYDFAKQLGFITEKKDDVFISKIGKNILNIYVSEKDKIEFSNYIFKECIFQNLEFIKVKNFLERFHEYENKLILEDENIEREDNDIIILLDELKIISFDKVWKIRDDIKNLVTINRGHKGKRKLSQEDIDKIKVEQKKVGDCAEKLSLAYEERYFEREKIDIKQIDHTSEFDDNAGYDIKSKWKKSRGKEMRESFIEVKGRKYDDNSFIISNNELNVAKMKGENFAIYFWKNVSKYLEDAAIAKFKKPYKQLSDAEKETLDCKTCDSAEPTRIIRDPIKTLKINLCDNCTEYRIPLENMIK